MFSADCTTQQAAFQTYSAGQNISCECVAVRVWNVVERSSTRCCVQDLLTTLHVHLMDETNSRAEISDCTNVCYTYHTQHQVSTPVIHARSYGAFCCKPRMTSGSYLRDMWEDPCRSTCYSCTMQVQARGIQATAKAYTQRARFDCCVVGCECGPCRRRSSQPSAG